MFPTKRRKLVFGLSSEDLSLIIWPGRSELSSDEKHRRKLWGQKQATHR